MALASTLRKNAVDVFELRQQIDGGLGTDAFDSGNIVRCVADQSLVVDHLLRPDAELLEYGLAIEVFHPFHCGGHQHLNAVVQELEGVLVAGEDNYLHAFVLGDFSHGADHVVGLEAGHFVVGNAQPLDALFDDRPLCFQVIRHVLPMSFVVGKLLMAERRRREVEGYRQAMRRVLLDQLEKRVVEADYRPGAGAVGAPPTLLDQGEEGAERQRASVYEVYAVIFHTAIFARCLSSWPVSRRNLDLMLPANNAPH
jgi:hypothetical protein